jgi:hypothetical protein
MAALTTLPANTDTLKYLWNPVLIYAVRNHWLVKSRTPAKAAKTPRESTEVRIRTVARRGPGLDGAEYLC